MSVTYDDKSIRMSATPSEQSSTSGTNESVTFEVYYTVNDTSSEGKHLTVTPEK